MPLADSDGTTRAADAAAPWQPSPRQSRQLVWLLLAVGLALRLLPIMWGTQAYDESQYDLHPDEKKIVLYAMDFPRSLFEEEDFRYPTFVHNAYGASLWWLEWVGALEARPETTESDAEARVSVESERYQRALLVCRLLTVLLGVLAMYLTYLFARRLFGPCTGLWTLALMNVAPLQVLYSATSMTEVPASVGLLAAMLLLLKMNQSEQIQTTSGLSVGLALGIATAAKYPAAIGVGAFAVCLAYWLVTRRVSLAQAGRLALDGFVYGWFGFLFFVPGIVIHFGAFVDSVLFELDDKLVSATFDPASFIRELRYTFGGIVLALSTVGAGFAVARRRSFFVLMLLGLIVSFLVILSRSYVSYYGIPIAPYVVTFAALTLTVAPQWMPARARAVQSAALAVVVVGTAFTGYVGFQRYAGDTRYRFQDWVEENVPTGPVSVSLVDGYPRRHLWACPKVPQGYEQVDALTQPEWVVLCERHYRPVKAVLEGRRTRKGFKYMDEPTEEALRFYGDVLLDRDTKYHYDLVKVLDPVDLPVGLRETTVKIYRRRDAR